MSKIRFTVNALAVVCFALFSASLAQAQATRTWVSGVGDDANPCSRTAPCKTFAGAISKTAANGEIDALDPGGYGAVTIVKGVTIDGNNVGSILATGTNAIVVNDTAGAPDLGKVIIRNLSINGTGGSLGASGGGLNGINIISAQAVSVEHCSIFGFTGSSGRGINDTRAAGGNLYVSDSIIENNGGSAVVVIPSSGTPTLQAVLNNVRLNHNGTNGVGTGFVIAGANVKGTISHSVLSKNPNFGTQSDLSSKMEVDNCWISYNVAGSDASGGSETRISNTVITFNTGANVSGNVLSYGNNMIRSNGTDNIPTIQGQQ